MVRRLSAAHHVRAVSFIGRSGGLVTGIEYETVEVRQDWNE